MDYASLCVNAGKDPVVYSDAGRYVCRAIRTKTVTAQDTLSAIIASYAKPVLEKGDILFICEKMVACTQGRAFPADSVRAGRLAKILCKFVTKSKAGIGLAMPQTMQCAINECGAARILLAAAAGMLGKVFGKKGWFYKVAGYRAACIDGPCHNTIPPYNKCVVLAPLNPQKAAEEASGMLGGGAVLIVDANDLGVRILGSSNCGLDKSQIASLLRQNPLGQSNESTPMGILRPVQ